MTDPRGMDGPPPAELRVGSDEQLDTVFSRKAVIALVVVGVLSFATAVGFAVFGKGVGAKPSARADAYSRSAIGHRGFVELLRQYDVPVVVSQHDSGNRAGDSGLLIVAEPLIAAGDTSAEAELRAMLSQAGTSLVILPKWFGTPDSERPDWVGEVYLLEGAEVLPTLQAVGVAPQTVLTRCSSWSASGFDLQPSLAAPYQLLVRSDDLIPVIACEDGSLLGQITSGTRTRYLLSDPDLLSNHGLDEGDNASLALAIVDQLRAGGAVVFDEIMHGYRNEPGVWNTLFEFPLVIATIQVLFSAALLLWAATGRFGAPLRGRPVLEPGKDFLIRNTADLLRFGGHSSHTLRRYLKTTVRAVARDLHAPPHLTGAALASWLDRLGEIRGLAVTLHGLEAEVEAAAAQKSHRRALLAANRIFRWRQEMTHGSSHHSLR